MTDTATLQAWLADAERAYHLLMTGTAQVRVKYEGREAEFNRQDAGDLAAYIASLKSRLGMGARRAFGVRLA